MFERPIVVYKDLNIDEELRIGYENDSMTRIYSAIGQRYNRCDDDVQDIINFRDSTLHSPSYGTGGKEIVLKNNTISN